MKKPHKIFSLLDIMENIIPKIGESEICKNKLTYLRKRLSNLRMARLVCKLWEDIARKEMIIEEYKIIYSTRFYCNICYREEDNYFGKKHHNYNWTAGLTKPQEKDKWTKLEGRIATCFLNNRGDLVKWICNGKTCTDHCKNDPGHCQRGKIMKWTQITFEEYKIIRQAELEDYYINTLGEQWINYSTNEETQLETTKAEPCNHK